MSRWDEASADCYLGNPAPRGMDRVFHHDLEKIAGGERCLECGELFLTPAAKKQAKQAKAILRALEIPENEAEDC